MIKIIQGQSNTVVLTLTESATLSSPSYLFHFKSLVTEKSKYFIAADISSYTGRYNEFIIEENSTEDLENGVVELTATGEYIYEVFEQTTSNNLNPQLSDNTKPIEVGMVKVIGTGQAVTKRTRTVTYKTR